MVVSQDHPSIPELESVANMTDWELQERMNSE